MAIRERLSLTLLGERLRERRRALEESQQAFAQRLQIPQSWVSELETASRPHVEADTVYYLCQGLGVSADYLLGLSDDPSPRHPRTPAAP